MVLPAEDLLLRMLPIFSNLPFLLAASRSLDYGYGFTAYLLAFVAIFTSPVYHICTGFPAACLWSFYKHRVVDFWSAELAIPVVGLIFIKFRAPYVKKWIIMTLVIVIGFLVTGTSSNFIGQAVIGAITIAVILVYIAWHRIAHGYWPEYDLVQVVLGVTFGTFGVSFFKVQDWWPPYYGYLHSYWHTFVAIGAYFFVGVRAPEPQYLNLEGKITDLMSSPPPEDEFIRAVGGYLNRQLETYAPVLRPKWRKFSAKGPLPMPRPSKDDNNARMPFIQALAFAPMD